MSWAHVDKRWAWDANFVWRYPREIAKCILSLSLKAFLERIEQGGGRGLAIPEKKRLTCYTSDIK